MYSSSTLYHSVRGRAKDFLRKMDHQSIYLLIAGSYTPFCLVTLRGPWGWSLFGVVWGLAVLGGLQELRPRNDARVLSVVIYLLMGWVALVALVPLVHALGRAGFAWVAAGGLFYTVGIVFYVRRHPPDPCTRCLALVRTRRQCRRTTLRSSSTSFEGSGVVPALRALTHRHPSARRPLCLPSRGYACAVSCS